MNETTRNLTIRDYLPLFIIFLVLITLPDLITWTTLSDGLVFNGTFVNLDDSNVYLSAMRQGSEGKWLFTSQHTSERLPRIISFIPYFLFGKLQSLIGGDEILWYELLRVFCGIFALYTLTILVKELFPYRQTLQRTSLQMLLFGSGISWFLIGANKKIPPFAADLLTPEWNLVTSSMSAPHYLLGIGCQALWFSWINQLTNNPNRNSTLKVFSAGALLSLSYPYLLPINLLVLAMHFGFECWILKFIPWKKVGHLAVALIPMVIFLLYYGVYIPSTPELTTTHLTNNRISSPGLVGVVVGYGLLGFYSLFGVKSFSSTSTGRLVLFWVVFNLVSLYLPFNFSGRFLLGLFIPVCLLAAEGLETKFLTQYQGDGITKSISKRALRRILVMITFPSAFLFLFWTITGPQSNPGFPFYYQEKETAALRWLGDNTISDDLVLAEYPIGNLIPRFSPARVFVGHLIHTIDLEEKQKLLEQFWDPSTSLAWKSNFVEQWGITYIYFGQFEQARSNSQFTPLGELVYDVEGVKIYSLLP
jgi:hypothetical protein